MKKSLKTRSNIIGKRTHGFRKKMSTRHGRKTISARRRKGRKNLCTV